MTITAVVILALYVSAGIAAAAAALFWRRPKRPPRDDNDDGGNVRRQPPDRPIPSPEWWPEFERDFAAHVRRRPTRVRG